MALRLVQDVPATGGLRLVEDVPSRTNRRGNRNPETSEQAFARREEERRIAEERARAEAEAERERNALIASDSSLNVIPRGVAKMGETAILGAGLARDVLAESQDSDAVSPWGILMRRAFGGAPAKETAGLLKAEEIRQDFARNKDAMFPKPRAQEQAEKYIAAADGPLETLGALWNNKLGSLQLAGESLASSLPAVRAAGVIAGSGLASAAEGAGIGEQVDAEYEALRQSPIYETLRRTIGEENLRKAAEQEKARRIQQTMIGATLGGAATAGVTSRVGLNPIDELVAGRAGAVSSKVPNLFREGGGEFFEGAGTQASVNLFTGEDVGKDVLKSGVTESALGALSAVPFDAANAGRGALNRIREIDRIGMQAADLTQQARNRQARDLTNRILPPTGDTATDSGAELADAALREAQVARPAPILDPMVAEPVTRPWDARVGEVLRDPLTGMPPVAPADIAEDEQIDTLLAPLWGQEDVRRIDPEAVSGDAGFPESLGAGNPPSAIGVPAAANSRAVMGAQTGGNRGVPAPSSAQGLGIDERPAAALAGRADEVSQNRAVAIDLPNGTYFIPGDPAAIRQRLRDAGVSWQGVERNIDGQQGVRFGANTREQVLGVLGGDLYAGSASGQGSSERTGDGSQNPASRGSLAGEQYPAAVGRVVSDLGQQGTVRTVESPRTGVAGEGANGAAWSPEARPAVSDLVGQDVQGLRRSDDPTQAEAAVDGPRPEQRGPLVAGNRGSVLASQESGRPAAVQTGDSGRGGSDYDAGIPQGNAVSAAEVGASGVGQSDVTDARARFRQRISPAVRRDQAVAQKLQSLKESWRLSDEQVALVRQTLAPELAVGTDRVTTFFRSEDLPDTMRAGQDYVRETGDRAAYGEIDFTNLGGLNKALGTAKADKHLAAVTRIVKEGLEAAGIDGAVNIRKGGDEFGIIAAGADRVQLGRVLAGIRQQVADYAQSSGLMTVPHTKAGRDPGIGIHFGTADIDTAADVDEIRGLADNQVERRKEGLDNYDEYAGPDAADGTGPVVVGRGEAQGSGAAREGDQGQDRGAQEQAAAAEGVGRETGSLGSQPAGPVDGVGGVGLEAGGGAEKVRSDAAGGGSDTARNASGLSVGDFRAELAAELGSKFARRLTSQPWFNLVASVDALPADVRKSITDADTVAGFVLPDGRVFVIAGNIPKGQAAGVTLHEVGVHFGMSGLPGFPAILAQFKRLRAKDGAVGAAYERAEAAAERDENGELTASAKALLDEEALAYFIEENWNARHPLIQRIFDAVVRMLNRLGVPMSALADKATTRNVLRGMIDKARAAANDAAAGRIAAGGAAKYSRQSPEARGSRSFDQAAQDVRAQVEAEGNVVRDTMPVDSLVDSSRIPTITLKDLVGKKVFPTIADRTAAAALYTGINSSQLEVSIPLLGGPMFPLREGNFNAGVVWANRGKGVTSQKAAKLKDGANYMMVVMGDADMHQSNTTVSNAFFGTLEAYARDGRISGENADALTSMVRESKNADPVIAKYMRDFPGFSDVAALDRYIHKMSFEARRRLLELLTSKQAQSHGAPAMSQILDATREPSLAGHRWGDGVLVVEVDQESPMVNLGDNGTLPHPDFPLGIKGKVVGKLQAPVNYELLWQDWLAKARADAVSRGTAEDKVNVRRAFELSKPIVEVTQELVSRVGDIRQANIDGHRQARLAVDFAAGNWRTSDAPVNQGGVSPQEFIDALNNSPAAATLTRYTLAEVKAGIKNGTMTIYQLGDGQVFFLLETRKDGSKYLASVVNNETGARGIGAPAVVLKALEEGATDLDAFAVKSAKFPQGFLPALYEAFGFEVTKRMRFDPQYFKPEMDEGARRLELADAVSFWKSSTPGFDPKREMPDVVEMKWSGSDADRQGISQRYLRSGLEGLLAGGVDRDVRGFAAEFGPSAQEASVEGRTAADRRGTARDQGTGAGASVASRARGVVQGVAALNDSEVRNLGLSAQDREVARSATQAPPREGLGASGPRYSRRTPQQAAAEAAQKRGALAQQVGATPGQTFTAKDRFTDDWRGTLRKAREKVQDKLLSVRDVQEDVEKVRGAVEDAMNVYRRENLMHGRVGQQRDQFERTHIKPLIEAMQRDKVSVELFEDYLEARHAEERNKAIASKKGGMPDAGAGMTTQAAADFLAGNAAGHRSGATITPDMVRKLDRLARRVDAITAETRKRMLDSGLITQQEYNTLQSGYQFYVPLRGKDGDEKAARGGTGKGIDSRGKVIQRALGRGDGNRAQNILAEIVADAERSIVRAEKARVGRTLARLVIENPNPDLWSIEPVKVEQAYSESADEIYLAVQNLDQDPNTIIVKSKGKPYRIYIEDTRIAEALKNMAVEQIGPVLQIAAGLNRYFSAVLTRYNPSFVAVNMTRDMLFGMTGLAAEHGVKEAAKAAAYYPQAMRAMWREVRGTLGTGRVDRYAQEFSEAGGKTYFGKIENVTDIAQRIGLEFKTARQIAFKDGRPLAAIGKMARDSRLVQAIENANDAVENALRLSAYIARREAGASVEQAAEYAKNLTVNFNRRGSATSLLNAFYLFFNASVQGSHRVFKLLKNRKVQGVLGGLAAIQAMFAMMALGYDDEDGEPLWDSIPDWEKQRNLIIVYPYIGADGKVKATTFKLPMPYGFNVFSYQGGRLASLVNDLRKDKKHAIRDYINDSTVAAAGAFAPLPFGEEGGWKAWQPHWLRLTGMLSENRDDLGIPIRQGDEYDRYDRPRAAKGRDDTSEVFKMAARGLNWIGGGDDYNKPMMPWLLDWAPEDLEFIAQTATGGLGSTVLKGERATEKAIAGIPVSFKDVPILSSFVSNVDQRQATANRYYEHKDEIERQVAQQRDIARQTGDVGDNKLGIRIARNNSGAKIKRDESYQLEGRSGSLYKVYKDAEKELSDLRDEMRSVHRDQSLSFTERARKLDALKAEREETQRKVNAKWREVFGRQPRT